MCIASDGNRVSPPKRRHMMKVTMVKKRKQYTGEERSTISRKHLLE